MQKVMIAGALVCTIGLTGCATNAGTGAGIGCLAGGIIGAVLLKDAKAGVALGCAAGGVVGFAWGSYLDEKERKELAAASIRAAAEGRTGERVAWGGPEEVTPAPAPAPHAKMAGKKHHGKSKPAATESTSTASSGVRTASAAQTNGATGWVVPVGDAYVQNGKTYRKLHQVASKDGKTYEHDIVAYKDGSTWVVPDNA